MKENVIQTICEVRCLHCGNWFSSPIHFREAESFFNSELRGSKQYCFNCQKWTDCNKDNMRFGERKTDGSVTYVLSKDCTVEYGSK